MSVHTSLSALRPASVHLRPSWIRSGCSALEGRPSARCHFFSSSSARLSTTSEGKKAKAGGSPAGASLLRSYFYHVDVHGQLFLNETEPKNLTSCFKSIPFLDFFYQRLGPNPATLSPPASSPTSSTNSKASAVQARRREFENEALRSGYPWLSPCGPEMNFVKAEASPVVFRELDDEGYLHWAGSFKMRFQPDKMVVDVETGYLYHPSPSLSPSASSTPAYGEYSLLSSSLVLTHLSSSLEYNDEGNGSDAEPAGSVEWQGKRCMLGVKPRGEPSVCVSEASVK
ncbi:unnamed protein product [Tilletia controversa]|uniref:Uncharacterized protein n=3 Tax=Tilletia TaxID=13289 RepID=A0A8X7MWR3_9BASI|nr:hypothetical protein CF336_g2133 [Tilletia laevis]KAE8203781.1 hypothetical protein CF328_g1461 [Tilletia controversa]KAE8264460.1 hypothetical protein A4X03_0g938 [Tilletia caries]KAE8252782.1 hypothetical protein A4X06_0g1936 [Tilletia controversa]CAD6896418.1 unnamed protein product [Tilletia caries]